MEIRQLEYFITVAECGAINRASENLFTSQPNISKSINSLEQELKVKLFIRSNKGVKLTSSGKEIYDYAKNILTNYKIMTSINNYSLNKTLSIACYPSHMISRAVCDYYNKNKYNNIDFLEGTTEETIEYVKSNKCEIGIVYIAQDKKCCFNHILEHKNLEFIQLDIKSACVYVGKNNAFYNKDKISFNELLSLKFIQPVKDLFSIEHYIDMVKSKDLLEDKFNNVITTNSDNLVIDSLLTTDIASFGIKLMNQDYEQYNIKYLDIEGYDNQIYIGYVKRKGEDLSSEAIDFIDLLKSKI